MKRPRKAFALVVLVAAAAGLTARQQRSLAEHNAATATLAETTAEARRAGASALATEDLDESMLLAVAGVRLSDTPETRTSLVSALARHHGPARIMVVATYRSTDVTGSTQPLHALKRDLIARRICREIVLEPREYGELAMLAGPAQRLVHAAAVDHVDVEVAVAVEEQYLCGD